jgi:hypothetical protein
MLCQRRIPICVLGTYCKYPHRHWSVRILPIKTKCQSLDAPLRTIRVWNRQTSSFSLACILGACLCLPTCPTGKTSLFTALYMLRYGAACWRGHAHILDRKPGSKCSFICSSTHSNIGHAIFEQLWIECICLRSWSRYLGSRLPKRAFPFRELE